MTKYKPQFNATLLEFQRKDVEKASKVPGFYCGNDMGLGKTYEAIALDYVRRKQHDTAWRTLIVAPLSLHEQWESTLADVTGLPIRRVNRKNRDLLMAREAAYYIVHWEVLAKMPELADNMWLHIIADEAHRMKNRKAQQTKALKKLPVAYKTALTGTPMENGRPDEMWSTLNWLYPKKFSSYWNFFYEMVDYEEDEYGYQKVVGPRRPQLLNAMIRPFFVEHLKKRRCCELHPQGAQADMPDKVVTDRWVDLPHDQRKMYDSLEKEMIALTDDGFIVAQNSGAMVTRLQQLAISKIDSEGNMVGPSPKIQELLNIIDDGSRDQQYVVASQYSQAIGLVRDAMQVNSIPYAQITGAEPQEARDAAVAAFRAGDVKVLGCTIGAGGVGLNLQNANEVIFIDSTWSPGKNEQMEDRVWRIGQTKKCHITYIRSRGTIDEAKAGTLRNKVDWIERIRRSRLKGG